MTLAVVHLQEVAADPLAVAVAAALPAPETVALEMRVPEKAASEMRPPEIMHPGTAHLARAQVETSRLGMCLPLAPKPHEVLKPTSLALTRADRLKASSPRAIKVGGSCHAALERSAQGLCGL